MKCEICNKSEAKEAINIVKGGEEQELYVCKDCARKEKSKRQQKRSRTRRVVGLPDGMEMSITEVSVSGDGNGPDGAPPLVKALLNAFHGIVSDIAQADEARRKRKPQPKKRNLPISRLVHPVFRIQGRVHLEGIFLIGELGRVKAAFEDLGLTLGETTGDGMRDIAHMYTISHADDEALARRALAALVEQEKFARIRLMEEIPRVLADTVCRVLATLKNCRLLSEMELLDLLATLRVVAIDNMLDGITLKEIDEMIAKIDVSFPEAEMPNSERDKVEAELADRINKRFEDVVLNDRAERMFLQ